MTNLLKQLKFQKRPIFTMVFVALTMVFVASTMVFVVATKVFVSLTMVFAILTMVFVLSTMVFVVLTTVFVTLTMVFITLTMVFIVPTMVFVVGTMVFVSETVVDVPETIFSPTGTLVSMIETTVFVVGTTVSPAKTLFSETEPTFYASEAGFAITRKAVGEPSISSFRLLKAPAALFSLFGQAARLIGARGINRGLALFDVANDAIFVDHERSAIGVALGFIVNAVFLDHRALEIAQYGESNADFFRPMGVGWGAVYADAENLCAGFFEFDDIRLIRL